MLSFDSARALERYGADGGCCRPFDPKPHGPNASAVSDLNRISCAQLAAILNGDDASFEGELARAENRRDNAKYAIPGHQQEHG